MNLKIHPECANQIERLKSKKHLTRLDFLELKTFGNDCYSNMTWEELKHYINEQTIVIVERFSEETNILAALRWVARGLPVNLAIRKISIDLSMYGYKKANSGRI